MLTVAVRPPEYFPRLAYCALFFCAERFVVADTFPYSRQSGQNRARVRAPGAGRTQWMTVPLRSGRSGPPMDEMQIAEGSRWPAKHRQALRAVYGTAPFYAHYAPELEALWARPWPSLGALAAGTTAWAHRVLRSPSTLVRASDLPSAPADLVAVLEETEAERLVTLPESERGDRVAVERVGVELEVVGYEESDRRQSFSGFEAGLSVLDLVMHYGPEASARLRDGIQRGNASDPHRRSDV